MLTPLETAYTIETKRLILRCWNPSDAPLLKTAIDESYEHLRPWLPWLGNESKSLLHYVEQLQYFRSCFDSNQEYVYGVFDHGETKVLGGSGLHKRVGSNAYEIGYWIHKDHINQGLASEVGAALTKIAFEVYKVNRVEIHCSPANIRAASIPQKLGFTHEATLRNRLSSSDGNFHDLMIWTLFSDAYQKNLASVCSVKAFNAIGSIIAL